MPVPGYLQGVRLMVKIKRRTSPVDYRLCNQTVTVYHWDGKNAYTRISTHALLAEGDGRLLRHRH